MDDTQLVGVLKKRAKAKCVYTANGPTMLVAVNPYEKLSIYGDETLERYAETRRLRTLPPHIFGIQLIHKICLNSILLLVFTYVYSEYYGDDSLERYAETGRLRTLPPHVFGIILIIQIRRISTRLFLLYIYIYIYRLRVSMAMRRWRDTPRRGGCGPCRRISLV